VNARSQSVFQEVIRTLEEQLPVDLHLRLSYDQVGKDSHRCRHWIRSRGLALELALAEHGHMLEIDDNGLSRCLKGHFGK